MASKRPRHRPSQAADPVECEPAFHIGADDESPRALCGHPFDRDQLPSPWHEGAWDCAECWRPYRESEAQAS